MLFAMLSFTAGQVAAQRPFAREYWLNESATPVRINALVQDAAGYMWLGTDAGLYRYNGNIFTIIEDTTKAPVTALCSMGDILWVGYKNGRVCKIIDNTIYPQTGPGLPTTAITSLKSLGSDAVIVTTEDQLFLITSVGIVNVGQKEGLPDGYFYSVAAVAPGHALLATDNGLSILQNKGSKWSVDYITASQGLPDPILRVVKSIPGTGLCWLGAQQGGVALYSTADRRAWIPACKGGWQWGQVNDILPVSAEKAFAITEEGFLLELTLKDSMHLEIVAHYYPNKILLKLLSDKTGNLWCATPENLLKISAPYAAYVPLGMPYALHLLTAITSDHSGKLWLAQDRNLYSLAIEDSIATPRFIANAPSGITSLFVDTQHRIWVGTLGNGLLLLPKGATAFRSARIDALREENILSIAGTDSSLWIASLTGVREIGYPDETGAQSIIRHHTKASGIGSDYVYQIFPDSKGQIWMATDGAGVAMYDGQKYHRWQGEVGTKVAYGITEDAQGDIWASTLEDGLFRYHDGIWSRFGREEGLQDLSISSLCATGNGQVVVVNRHGIDQWYSGSSQFRHYNRRLGVDIDSTSSVLNCIARDDAGNVFVPFEHGIIKLKNTGSDIDIRPSVRIAQIGLFMSPIDPSRNEFDYNENYLSFSLDGINYANPEHLNYRYKLEGFNNDWIQTNDERLIFPRLPPGRYTFRLQGSMNQRFSRSSVTNYSFTVAPPVWRRAWFIVIAALLVAAFAWAFIRLRDIRLSSLLRLKQERLTFEYEHLKSQVNPHFLFNSLNTLTGLIEDGENDAAGAYTAQLSDLYRNMLMYRDRDLILVSEEWNILAAYLHIQHTRFEDAFRVEADIAESVMQQRKIVPMSLQLLVENAIKHNVVSRSTPLIIRITADENTITVANALQPKLSAQRGAGLGLNHILRRYELLTKHKVTFGPNNGHFIVTLPLL
jgi:ligand-binding sensor domain-containing protein